jgi:hypothetical protein
MGRQNPISHLFSSRFSANFESGGTPRQRATRCGWFYQEPLVGGKHDGMRFDAPRRRTRSSATTTTGRHPQQGRASPQATLIFGVVSPKRSNLSSIAGHGRPN